MIWRLAGGLIRLPFRLLWVMATSLLRLLAGAVVLLGLLGLVVGLLIERS